MGLIAAGVIAVALLGIWAISGTHTTKSLNQALAGVSDKALSASELKIAVISMDKIQMDWHKICRIEITQ